jgi:hypothetical protein
MALSKVNYNSLNVTPTASKFLKWDSDADALEAGDVGGSLTLISTQTASSSATLSFTSGIDSTYKEYIFKFINIHIETLNAYLTFQASTDGGSNYNTACTSTIFGAYHDEGDTAATFGYHTGRDVAQSTSFVPLQIDGGGVDNDDSICGTLHFYDPSSTTFVKHFMYEDNHTGQSAKYCFTVYTAGYFNTTSAIDAIQFKMSTGNIDSGVIKMYGVS